MPAHKSIVYNGISSFLSDSSVLDIAFGAKNGEKFKKLWEGDTTGYASPSEADLALCSHLAFYCGGDAEQMDRLMRQSDLCREKWDRDDYRETTLRKAVDGCKEFYKPLVISSAAEDFSNIADMLRTLNAAENKRYSEDDIETSDSICHKMPRREN